MYTHTTTSNLWWNLDWIKKRTKKGENFREENLPAQWTLFNLVIMHHYYYCIGTDETFCVQNSRVNFSWKCRKMYMDESIMKEIVEVYIFIFEIMMLKMHSRWNLMTFALSVSPKMKKKVYSVFHSLNNVGKCW